MPSCRRCGVSAISNRIARWRAARPYWPEAKTFREKKLPCDTMIYLGTGFCPSGWNTNNGEFTFNEKVFPDPKAMFDQLHQDHFKVVLHVAYPTGIREMHGAAKDACDPKQRAETQSSCYWDMHRPLLKTGVDGWWPDEGDALNTPSRLVRNRMYWEASQIDRPNERPFALHRNGYAGMQRYGSFLWSGDVNSQWETLRNHVPIAVNTGLTGIPYWGTDIGGFVPTKEFTGELYVRWFQFAAFNTLFRSHGRTWMLRLPWGWNTGETGPVETPNVPLDPKELHNAQVEPICRKYLELRYRMMPYLYSAVRECTQTGMPVMRALWLHYPDDADGGRARRPVSCGAATCWWRRWWRRARRRAASICRAAPGTTSGPANGWKAAAKSRARSIWRRCRSTCAPGRSCRWVRVKQYTAEKVEGPIDRDGLSGRERLVPALRRRRQLVQLSQGRVDGTRDGMERCPESACGETGRRVENAGQARTRSQIGECNQAGDV